MTYENNQQNINQASEKPAMQLNQTKRPAEGYSSQRGDGQRSQGQFASGRRPFQKRNQEQSAEQSKYSYSSFPVRRVTKVREGGKTMSYSAFVVAGDKAGNLGFGVGKSLDQREALNKAKKRATARMFPVKIWNDTIPHRCECKFKSSKVLLMPAPMGTGLIAGGAIRTICELAGIKNIRAKSFASSNTQTLSMATINALLKLRTKAEQYKMLKS